MHLSKFHVKKFFFLGGDSSTNVPTLSVRASFRIVYFFEKTQEIIKKSLKIMTKALKTLLIGQLCSQKHREMFCGGRRIIFKHPRKNLDRFFDFFLFQNDPKG